MVIDWQEVRSRFPVAERRIYLNTGWSGPSSRDVVRAMQQRLEREAFDGPTTLAVRDEKGLLVRRAREAVAASIGASEDEIALIYTTTEGVNTVLRGIGLKPGDQVITCNLEHNAVMVPSYVSRMRDGIDLKIVRFPSAGETASSMVDTFAAAMTPRTKLLLLSQISYNRGTRLPMREICAMAHARCALVAVDAAQSAGQIAIDVRAMGCDFLALPGHKWLLGPDGAAFLYVRRDLIERLQPLAVVHGANAGYDFEGHFEYANATIHKFEQTTHSGPVLAGLETSLAMIAGIGTANVEERCLALASRFIEGLQAADGVRVTTPLDPSVRSGIVTFTVRDIDPAETAAALEQIAGAVVRVCNQRRVRACFHIFNDESDVDRTLDAVRQLSAHGLPQGALSAEAYRAMLREAED